MRNAARPKVREQIHPKALEIIDKIEPVIEGYDDEGNCRWNGPSENFWAAMCDDVPLLMALIKILQFDFPTFCAVMLRIKHKETLALRPFIFNCAQAYLWMRVVALMVQGLAVWVDILKSRQVGISTFVAAWQFWMLWRSSDLEVLMVGNTKKLVEQFIDTFRLFHDELPNIATIKPRTRAAKGGNARIPKHEAYFEDRRSKATILVESKNFESRGLHGISIQLSEAAYYEDLNNVLLSLKPILPPLGSAAHKRSAIWIETTPRGQNFFYDHYNHAKSGLSSYHAIFIPWMVSEDLYSVDPPKGWKLDAEDEQIRKKLSAERRKVEGKTVTLAQMYWRELEMADQGWDEEMFDQEYPSNDSDCFLLRTRSIFKRDLRWLRECVSSMETQVAAAFAERGVKIDGRARYVEGEMIFPEAPSIFSDAPAPRFTPRFKMEKGGRLRVWAPPRKGHAYVIGCDPAGGDGDPNDAFDGSDSGVLSVLDVTAGEQVAEFASSTISPEGLADQAAALGYWYNIAVVLPEVNVLSNTMKRLKQVWKYPRVGREEKWDEVGFKKKFGYWMTPDTKRALVMEIKYILSRHQVKIASDQLLKELSTFESDSTDAGMPTYGAASGSHDDRVIAFGLALMAVKQSPKLSRMLERHSFSKVPTAEELGLTDAPAPAIEQPFRAGELGSGEIAGMNNPWAEMDPTLLRQLGVNTSGKATKIRSSLPANPISG